MAKISPCFKRTFVFFNSLFAIFGIVIIVLGLIGQQYAEEQHTMTGVIVMYVMGSVIFGFAVLGAYGAHKESKCALIVFFILMCLATAGMLRISIPIAMSRPKMNLIVHDYFKQAVPLTRDVEHTLNPVQTQFHCCGLINGYKDWQAEVPDSCNCVDSHEDDVCERITSYTYNQLQSRRVWSKPCGPLIIEYLDYILAIVLVVFFSLAALAILGGLMSLAMIVRVTASTSTPLPTFPLSYQPPKYSEVVNF